MSISGAIGQSVATQATNLASQLTTVTWRSRFVNLIKGYAKVWVLTTSTAMGFALGCLVSYMILNLGPRSSYRSRNTIFSSPLIAGFTMCLAGCGAVGLSRGASKLMGHPFSRAASISIVVIALAILTICNIIGKNNNRYNRYYYY